MYLVAQKYLDKEKTLHTMSEAYHETLDSALADHAERTSKGYHDLIIARILTVKTVVVDFTTEELHELAKPGERMQDTANRMNEGCKLTKPS
jgi:hypothetical protein